MNIQKLEEKRDYLSKLGPFKDAELELIKQDVILLNTHSRNESPNALTDEEKIAMIKNKCEIPKGMFDQYYYEKLIGIERAYNYILYTINEESNFPYPPGYKHPFDEECLKSFNQIILGPHRRYEPFEKGNFRRGTNEDKLGDRILPKRDIFIKRLKDLIKWYNETDYDLFTKLAIFHLKFEEEIHPFYDGNGRTGRMIMNLELAREGYPMIGLKYNDVQTYEKAFVLYRNIADHEYMKLLIYKNVNQQLDKNILMKKQNR